VSVDDWFSRNEMNQYTETINGRRMLSPISVTPCSFEQKAMSSFGQSEWVVHVMVYSPELRSLYCNARLHDVTGVSREFLFARFAYTIFPQVRGFLQLSIDRNLLSISLAKEYGKVYTASPDECKDSYHK